MAEKEPGRVNEDELAYVLSNYPLEESMTEGQTEVPEGYEVAPKDEWPMGWTEEMGPWIRPTHETVQKLIKDGETVVEKLAQERQTKLPRWDKDLLTTIIDI